MLKWETLVSHHSAEWEYCSSSCTGLTNCRGGLTYQLPRLLASVELAIMGSCRAALRLDSIIVSFWCVSVARKYKMLSSMCALWYICDHENAVTVMHS